MCHFIIAQVGLGFRLVKDVIQLGTHTQGQDGLPFAAGFDDVRAYIREQEEHHRRRTFQEEFMEFLRRYEVDYDERYLWD